MESLGIAYPDNIADQIYQTEGTDTYSMLEGETITLGYTVSPDESGLAYPGVEWTSSDSGVAEVDKDGVVTAVKEGTAFITLSAADDRNDVPDAVLRIEVNEKVEEPVKVSEINISVKDGGLNACYVEGTIQLVAAVEPDDAADKSLEWSSADEEVATVDADGLVTAHKAGEVKITATASDDDTDPAKGEITLYVDAEVEFSLSNVDEAALTLPAGGTFEFKTELTEGTTEVSYSWNSSSTEIATVSEGVLSVLDAFGETEVSVTCTGKTAHGLDFEKTADVQVTVPQGYYYETLPSAERVYWTLNSEHSQNGAKSVFTEGPENYLLVTPYSNGTKGRADLQHKETYIDGTEYPVICFRVDDLQDKGHACNINLDTSGEVDGTKFSGWVGGNNNRWAVKYTCSDGSSIIVYDLSSQNFQNGGEWPEGKIGTFTTFQLKYADIADFTDVNELQYRFFWFKTFPSMDAMKTHLDEWSASAQITYAEVN